MENTSGVKPTHVAHVNNIFYIDQGIQLIKQSLLDHASINHIKQNLSVLLFLCGNEIYLMTPNEILKRLKETVTKKTVGFDMIPHKFVKIAVQVLCSSLSKAINSLLQSVF